MGHEMHWRRSWNYYTYRLCDSYHWLSISGSIVPYASYLCLSSWPLHRFCLKQVWNKLAAGLRPAFDMLSTCLRHAHASLRPGLQPGLQLARIMECGLHSVLVCEILSKSDHPRQKKMTSCRFSRRRISAILDCRDPIMGSLESPVKLT